MRVIIPGREGLTSEQKLGQELRALAAEVEQGRVLVFSVMAVRADGSTEVRVGVDDRQPSQLGHRIVHRTSLQLSEVIRQLHRGFLITGADIKCEAWRRMLARSAAVSAPNLERFIAPKSGARGP